MAVALFDALGRITLPTQEEIERGIRAEVPEARIIYIEPDVLRTGAPNDADPDPTPS